LEKALNSSNINNSFVYSIIKLKLNQWVWFWGIIISV
jgi:hypothetical protein